VRSYLFATCISINIRCVGGGVLLINVFLCRIMLVSVGYTIMYE